MSKKRERGEGVSPNPMGGFKPLVVVDAKANSIERSLYFEWCSKLANRRTVKYLLKRIIKVMYRT